MKRAIIFIIFAIAGSAVVSFGANTTMYAAGANHTVRTNTSGGYCDEGTVQADGSVTYVCLDGNISVVINDARGCMSVSGGGSQCAIGNPPENGYNSEDVTCPNGRVWTISNGNGNSDSHCDTNTNTQTGVTGGTCGNGQGVGETNHVDLDCNCGTSGCCLNMTGASTCSCWNCP